jgi:2-keto-4-pentenoate hydratase/2-oxohepta-3-ene-1,7-dioic acid hydratase in catechol pathway
VRFGRFIFQGREVFGDVDENFMVSLVRPEDQEALGRTEFPMQEAIVLAPVIPSKIIAIGLNYRAHAAEMGKPLPEEPLMFMKPATAIIASGEAIVIPPQSKRVDFEGELAVVIGKQCRNVSAENAPEFILGYTCMNDVTARDLQKKDVQYTRAKGFDTFAPLGPFLVTELDPSNLRIQTFVNGEQRQDSTTADMIFSVNQLIAFVSSVMTLLPGDIISTGTPSGVGPVQPGDLVEVQIQNIGRLRNTVVGATA